MTIFYIRQFRQGITLAALSITMVLAGAQEIRAQLNPLSSIYYQNQYLANPAMAGLEDGLRLNYSYCKQWSSMVGSPQIQSFTGDYGFSKRVGFGLNIYNDKAGLLQNTRIMGSYAYHLPIGTNNKKLSFGISFGFSNEYINNRKVNGDEDDASVGRFNQREVFIDGDFGVAYTAERLTVQVAIPNLKTYFKKDENKNTVDNSIFYSAISYKFYPNRSLTDLKIEPKIAYRGVKGYYNIIDLGANITVIDDALSFVGIWHSSKSATFGVGLNYKKMFTFTGMYTTQTGMMAGYNNGDFELALKVNLF